MNYDVHILLACLVGITFAALLLTAAGRNPVSRQESIRQMPQRSRPQQERRRAA